MKGWNRFCAQYTKDVKLWLLLAAFLQAFRLFFIFYFRRSMGASSAWTDVALAMLQGIRFDAKVATTVVAVPFLFTIASMLFDIGRAADRFRRIYASFMIVVFTAICFVSVGYFQEYGDQYNFFLYNFFYDDSKAILATIWSAYHPLAYLAAIALFSGMVMALMRRLLGGDHQANNALAERTRTIPRKTAAVLVIAFLFVVGARGTLHGSRLKTQEASITKDEFLNKTVVNPVYALQSSYQDFRSNRAIKGPEFFFPDRNVAGAERLVFPGAESFGDLDRSMLKRARGSRNAPPRHVFLIVMESYDSWPLLPGYASLGVSDRLKGIARRGLWFDHFLPSGPLTSPSYASILTSIPSSTMDMMYQNASLTAYPSSLAGEFKRLGYRTRLFYGGYLSWHRFGDFNRTQGFDEQYSAPNYGGWDSRNEWGVPDEYLFRFAAETVDDRTPSFNLILTTSNHPPFTADALIKGFPLKSVPAGLTDRVHDAATLAMLGHKWYADRCIGEFVDRTEKRLHRPLFAFTGDHYSRTSLNGNQSAYESSSVPFILYGPDVLRGISPPKGAVGSHIDIGPTLIELAAPKGFVYYSFGRNLLAPDQNRLGIGWWKVIGPDFLFDALSGEFAPLPGQSLPVRLPDARELKSLVNAYYGLAWLRATSGPIISR